MKIQSEFPPAPDWLDPGNPDFSGYACPDRSEPGLLRRGGTGPLISVIGTVKNERVPLSRSLQIWMEQKLPAWLHGRVEYWVLDDGSSDDPRYTVETYRNLGKPVRYAKFREDGGEDRSCTLVHNAAIKQLVKSPLVMIQWWDRIPGSFNHLSALATPHLKSGGIVTSPISRHIGGSSSVKGMSPEQLAAQLALVPWQHYPQELEKVAGPAGNHCVPGTATESSGMMLPVKEFIALGGYDERYKDRAGYVNVEFFRRALDSGLSFVFPDESRANNFHQSHFSNRQKSNGWLHDKKVKRNQGVDWGILEPIEVW